MINKLLDFLKNKNVLILGFGDEGQSTYKFIRKYLPNKIICVSDREKNFNEKHEFLSEDNNLQIISGNEYLENLESYDIIIKSPGISLKDIDTTKFLNKITSQLQLLLEFFNVYTIGITGTKGKSTTSSLIYSIIAEQNVNALFLGNIGIPIFDYIEVIKENMTIVLEISSHQLEYITRSPNIAILLNLFEEHLDHYKSINEYINAKFNIAKFQKKTDYFIYNIDNDLIDQHLKKDLNINAQKYEITYCNQHNSDKVLYTDNDNIYFKNNEQIQLLYDTNNKRNLIGTHNLNNIMFALAVSEILKLDINNTVKTINNFEPLSHRMEYVGQFDGIHYYNDSIATIPEATINCIESLKNINTLIIGGMDRGVDFTKFIEYLCKGVVKNIICMPSTGIFIGEQIIKNNANNINVFKVEDLKEAVSLSKRITEKDRICALSPAAASYGYFKNFKEKGEEFKRLVRK